MQKFNSLKFDIRILRKILGTMKKKLHLGFVSFAKEVKGSNVLVWGETESTAVSFSKLLEKIFKGQLSLQ